MPTSASDNQGVQLSSQVPVDRASWGTLQWMVNRQNGSSTRMTVGRVTIDPGQSNPLHQHPNCEEVLYVLSGRIAHTLPNGGSVALEPGDCIVIEPGIFHRAVNIGSEPAVVLVAFNSADRQTIVQGEGSEQ